MRNVASSLAPKSAAGSTVSIPSTPSATSVTSACSSGSLSARGDSLTTSTLARQPCIVAAPRTVRSNRLFMNSISAVVSPRASASICARSAMTLLAVPASARPTFTRVIPSACREIP